jgi:hypothetical protein
MEKEIDVAEGVRGGDWRWSEEMARSAEKVG